MKPVFFSFRAGLDPAARTAALEKIRSLPAVERAGEMYPGATEGESAGTMVAAVGDAFDPHDVLSALSGMDEIEEASEPAERRLVESG